MSKLIPCRTSLAIFALLLSAAGFGCSQRNMLNLKQLNIGPNKQSPPISRIVCLWKAAQGRDMKGQPARGVAGQILFFTAGSDRPVKFEGNGELLVYLFDDQGTPDEQTKPIHRFRFSSEAWNLHLHNGSLGPSYHVFIPYTRNVVHQVEVAVNVRLIPENGPSASSDMISVTLPGPIREKDRKPLAEVVSGNRNGEKTTVTTFNDRFFHGSNAVTKRNHTPENPQPTPQSPQPTPQSPRAAPRGTTGIRQTAFTAPGEQTPPDATGGTTPESRLNQLKQQAFGDDSLQRAAHQSRPKTRRPQTNGDINPQPSADAPPGRSFRLHVSPGDSQRPQQTSQGPQQSRSGLRRARTTESQNRHPLRDDSPASSNHSPAPDISQHDPPPSKTAVPVSRQHHRHPLAIDEHPLLAQQRKTSATGSGALNGNTTQRISGGEDRDGLPVPDSNNERSGGRSQSLSAPLPQRNEETDVIPLQNDDAPGNRTRRLLNSPTARELLQNGDDGGIGAWNHP